MKAPADRLLVKPIEKELTSELYIHQTGRQRPDRGIVEIVGKDVLETKVGDMVLFGTSAGTETLIDGEKKIILREVEVLFIL